MEVSNIALSRSRIDVLVCLLRRSLSWITRLPLLILDIPLGSFSPKISAMERQLIIDTLAPGDILLTSDKLFPVWQIAVSFIGSSRFSHAAVYEGNYQVIEATTFHPSGDGVARTAVDDFLSGRKTVCVIRPAYPAEYKKMLLLAYLEQQLGKPYDYGFCSDAPDAMYCAKLVGKALDAAGLTVSTKQIWKRRVYLPDAFISMEGSEVVYRKPETALQRLVVCQTLAFISLAVLAALLVNPVALPAFCLAWAATGWLQHLKLF